MNARIHLEGQRLVGTNGRGHETLFDTTLAGGGLNSAASPMEVALESAAACTAMDVLPILRKQRSTITDFSIDLTAERATEHPKVFTSITMDVRLVSPDATVRELARAIALSQSKYCSVSIMLARSGCRIQWKATIINPDTHEEESISSQEYLS